MTKLDTIQQQIARRVNDRTDADPLKTALEYASHGYRVVPLYVRDEVGTCGCFLGDRCIIASGHPCVDDSTTDTESLNQWWSEWPAAEVGLVTGSCGGFVSLQFGHASDGADTVATFEADYGPLPSTARRQMAEGGTQYFFRLGDGEIIKSLSSLAALPNTRLRGESMSVQAPPLNHDQGGGHISRIDEMPEVPPTLLAELRSSESSTGVCAFPVDALPGPMRRLIEEGARSLSCPPELLGVPMLAVTAASIGGARIVEVKADWHEPPILYAAVVAKPGELKSPALQMVAKPIYECQRQLSKSYDEQLDQHHQVEERYHIDRKFWENAVRRHTQNQGPEPGPAPIKPAEPVRRQLFTTDATVEAIAVLLAQNLRGVLVLQDEFVHWLGGMDQYKSAQGADRQFWLSIWNATTTCVNRKGDKHPIQLDHPVVSVTGCLPPDLLEEINDRFGRDDGLLDRVLFAFPATSHPRWSDYAVAGETHDKYSQVLDTLAALEPHVDDDGRSRPKTVPLTAAARQAFREWVESHLTENEQANFPQNLSGAWSKMRGYCARLALIIHMARVASDEVDGEAIDEQSVAAAIRLAEYFKSTARRVRVQLSADETGRQHERVVNWIRKQGGEASLRDLLRNGVGGLKTADDARRVFREMEMKKMGTACSEPRGRVVFQLDRRYLG